MQQTYGTYYRDGPHADFVTQLRDSEIKPFTFLEVFHPRGDYPDPPMREYALFLITKGNAMSHFDYGNGRKSVHCRPGTIGLAPPEVAAQYTVDGSLGYVGLTFPMDTVARFFRENYGRSTNCLNRLHEQTFECDAIAALLLTIAAEAASNRLQIDIVADSMLLTILNLLDIKARPSRPRPSAPRLSSDQHRRITDYVLENLGRPIRLAQLAILLDISEAHLVRAFKATLGMTPHRFVISERVKKACSMICETSAPLAEIAADTGFASQSHMSDTFRKHVGIPPGELRRASHI
jgi:AraC family transcriptional regulator